MFCRGTMSYYRSFFQFPEYYVEYNRLPGYYMQNDRHTTHTRKSKMESFNARIMHLCGCM